MKTPSEELADLISPLLAHAGLFIPEDAAKYKPKLAAGSMKSEDWLLAIEKAQAKGSSQ